MADRARHRELLSRLISASAGVVALSALAVSTYQAYIARQQQKMSAWPYVTQGNTGADGYARLVQNVGLGPALVRSVIVTVDGRRVRTWGALLQASLRVDSVALQARLGRTRFVTSSVWRGTVLLPGSTTELARVEPGPFAADVRGALNDARVRLRVCYCSMYDDCWTSDSGQIEPARVPRCPDDPAGEFRS